MGMEHIGCHAVLLEIVIASPVASTSTHRFEEQLHSHFYAKVRFLSVGRTFSIWRCDPAEPVRLIGPHSALFTISHLPLPFAALASATAAADLPEVLCYLWN